MKHGRAVGRVEAALAAETRLLSHHVSCRVSQGLDPTYELREKTDLADQIKKAV